MSRFIFFAPFARAPFALASAASAAGSGWAATALLRRAAPSKRTAPGFAGRAFGLALLAGFCAPSFAAGPAEDCVADPASASALMRDQESPGSRPPLCLYTPDQPVRAKLNAFNFPRPKNWASSEDSEENRLGSAAETPTAFHAASARSNSSFE